MNRRRKIEARGGWRQQQEQEQQQEEQQEQEQEQEQEQQQQRTITTPPNTDARRRTHSPALIITAPPR